tara:strand:- start:495 stop:1895 length:1401 start_codon:yes stop_codon:yes gene_type:complete
MAIQNFNLQDGTQAINTILAEEANRIGQDIYKRTLHTSPWIDLVKQSAFPDGMGYQLTTLVYDRAIPTSDANGAGNVAGVTWRNLGVLNSGANSFSTSDLSQPLKDAADSTQGGRGGVAADGSVSDNDSRSFIQFSKQLKEYSIQRAVVESPRISLEDLRFAAHRQEQLRAVMDLMTEATRYTWENRYRDEFDRLAANVAFCRTSSSTVSSYKSASTTFEGTATVDIDTTSVDYTDDGASNAGTETPNANISNAVLDKIYYQLIRKGAGSNAYGRENGRPVFGLVLSSEASYQLMTEAGFRDDVRYNNAKVSDLIAPLGIEKSFRGFYHLVDDLAPRFELDTDTDGGGSDTADGTLNAVLPYTTSSGITSPNASYETATYEAAYVIHPEVMESQIPNPFSGVSGIKFDPVNYRGKFDFKNILNEDTNPDGQIGFFRGVLASASKPIKTDFGYVILFDRTSTTPAAV